ncbi:bifunctional phosphatidyl-N-methylethanolamine N-methyltransferase/phosphatidyl-N-dimethylethanolamine N-methyltransferase PWA37_002985 [Arxiozyma heterogenica]|uniref:bifunctional phosphatidyl-N-methylethanolamine N-methyltransferase/phosphatidyl-N-dimethylethanolamine N-methyltransferase n=1 Tax=Arxiozyma heterogenica TaxID=278026 RepID=UPI002F0CD69C
MDTQLLPSEPKLSILEHLEAFSSTVNFEDKYFQYCTFFVVFNPVFWNIVARTEYNYRLLTRLTKSPKTGCYLLALIIFSLGLLRDYMFNQALRQQLPLTLLQNDTVKCLAVLCFAMGQLLVITSMYRLGIIGTYLGDYFGILMKERVTGFPFNISNNPMYQGSTLSFLGTALYYGKPAGLVITLFVYIMYKVALRFEEPFTAMIYAKKKF